MVLQREREFFESHEACWLAQGNQGRWAVIRHEQLEGFFPSWAEGLAAGVRSWGLRSFLVKRIGPECPSVLDLAPRNRCLAPA